MIAKTVIAVAVILFFINWACLLSSRKFKSFPYGDFILFFLCAALVMANAERLKAFFGMVPDLVSVATMETDAQLHDVRQGIEETKETINIISSAAKDIIAEDIEELMNYKTPGQR